MHLKELNTKLSLIPINHEKEISIHAVRHMKCDVVKNIIQGSYLAKDKDEDQYENRKQLQSTDKHGN